METARYLQPSSNVSDFELQFIQTAPFRKKKTGSLGFATIQFATIKPFFKHGKSFVFKVIKIHFFLDLNKTLLSAFKQWLLQDCRYSVNYTRQLLSILKTLCVDAQKNDIATHPYTNFIRGCSLPTQAKIIHTLSFEEIKTIEKTIVPKTLENTQK